MTDIFISYATEDRDRAHSLANAFEREHWTVWWDHKIPAGHEFDEYIRERLDEALCIVVLWSSVSINSKWVKREATRAREREKLVPVLIEDVKPPWTFEELQCSDLSGGQDYAESDEFQSLLGDLRQRIAGNTQPDNAASPDRTSRSESASYDPSDQSPSVESSEDGLIETGPNVRKIHERSHPFIDVNAHDFASLKVPNHPTAYSSFQPTQDQKFLRIYFSTTNGFVKDVEVENKIYTVEDPIRPYTIQIGETRSLRKEDKPDAIPDLASLDLKGIQLMSPVIQTSEHQWLRMVLAELAVDPDVLRFLAENEAENSPVRSIAANNPSAPHDLQQEECLFCKPRFREPRRVPEASTPETIVIRNDFPYGPYFHYIAMPSDPVHSWEDIEEHQLRHMNLAIWRFLRSEHMANRLKSPGVHVGLNSTIRHLVLGRRTKASAGASIAHVHKQFWGMSPASVNIGDYLASVITSHLKTNDGVDYLHEYIESIREAGLVIWEDANVALYVPIAQMSLHELQIIVKRETHSFVELTESEVTSLSRAEYYLTEIYKSIGITSFNELLITEKVATSTPGFRLIFTFVTREIDLAVSELNNLFVVDKYPNDTITTVKSRWESKQ